MLALAAVLRFLWLDAGWFGIDQARDLTWGARIASGEAFPALGPPMRNRVHLGAVYYFFWAIPFFFSASPLAAYAFAALLGVGAVWLTYLVGRRLGGPWSGVAAAALLACSPVGVIDARVAWAPAALPPVVAALLWACARFLEVPYRSRAALVAVLGALATQLHLAAAPVLAVALGVILSRRRVLGPKGLMVAAGALVVPLLPMVWAFFSSPAGAGSIAEGIASPYASRLTDVLLSSSRPLDGLSPPSSARPMLVNLWLTLEGGWLLVVLAALAWALVARPGSPQAAPLRLVTALLLLVSLAAVALLPGEAWYYYLDTSLVPGALLVGLAVTHVPLGRARAWLLSGVVVARTALVVWWVVVAHQSGFIPVNVDLLRLGGARPADLDGRARVLGVATRTAAAEILVDDLNVSPERIWRDVHGPGFSDLDNDNGYFLHRAADRRGLPEADGASALITHRDGYPAGWIDGLGPSFEAGPLEVVGYRPLLDRTRARLEGCGGGPPPARVVPDPLEYGTGELPRPEWPCPDPVVIVPVAAPDEPAVVRAFVRVDGAGRVVSIEADPPGRAIAPESLGLGAAAGVGLLLDDLPATLRIRLHVDGPAALDLYELRGKGSQAPNGGAAGARGMAAP